MVGEGPPCKNPFGSGTAPQAVAGDIRTGVQALAQWSVAG
jgi:hypothetical protein